MVLVGRRDRTHNSARQCRISWHLATVSGRLAWRSSSKPIPRNRILRDPDRFEALLGDAKRHGSSFSIAAPAQQRAVGADLFQQPGADELIDRLAKRFARYVCWQVHSAIIAPRSRGENDALRIGES